MSKNKSPENKEKLNPKDLHVKWRKDEEPGRAVARTFLQPSAQSALTIKDLKQNIEELSVMHLLDELNEQMRSVQNGDMSRMESILVAQTHMLDTLCSHYVQNAQATKNHDTFKIYMNIALKAQSQCRSSIEALSELKNPKPYIQNNRAQYQQVNNGNAESPARAEKSKSSNELLEDKTDEQEWLDTGTPETAGGNDKELETVGAKHRTKNAGGQGSQ